MKNNWKELTNTMEANFEFNSFQEALKFVNMVGKLAEIQNHHPNILMHNYNQVKITVSTIDSGNKLTIKDFRLAKSINRLSRPFL
ncbi:MAG: 4a-hydroxytetrahydrobiopterin dehydratase [Crocinitomicaceae bacterium]|jgi:4a-hydroxytetrahydrobiopterin dehydratase|nr:4a-hydroxytetrahydrobiopterin dehydratase [Crocinitomicaceae bacterium]MBT5402473.1 4a-hydroxytetrahydrobiopterin dehydratase [Crocinitomicaceae bacterium]MBT6515208.1 4a-hydroxytetrahydrobiopterin dehydratase [Crocinitomicaceae bacterium]MDG2330714.1 4a-hydroxytetrahydrobiopterin dehydratase [Flavobacteriales bacterium]